MKISLTQNVHTGIRDADYTQVLPYEKASFSLKWVFRNLLVNAKSTFFTHTNIYMYRYMYIHMEESINLHG